MFSFLFGIDWIAWSLPIVAHDIVFFGRYVLGGRDLSVAVKMKPDYLEGGLNELDMLIVGGLYGGGACLEDKTKKMELSLSSFLLLKVAPNLA